MIKILFVCHGNICRSPMAEYVFKDMVRRQGMEDAFEISSAATSREEIGNGVHPGTRRKLKEVGIPCGNHRARQMTGKDYAYYDYLIGMEQWNLRNMYRLAGVGPEKDSPKKIWRLLDFGSRPRDIADPWYTGDFDEAYRDIDEGCRALLQKILKKK